MVDIEAEIELVVEVSVAKATSVMAPLAMSIKAQGMNSFPLLVLSSFHLDLNSSIFNRRPSSSVFPNRDLAQVCA